MSNYRIIVIFSIFFTAFDCNSNEANDDVVELKYGSWTIQYNCEKRGYQSFHYKTVPDTGNLPRLKPFHQDLQLPEHCRQFSIKPYQLPKSYDV